MIKSKQSTTKVGRLVIGRYVRAGLVRATVSRALLPFLPVSIGATSMSDTMALSNHSQQLKAVVYGAAVAMRSGFRMNSWAVTPSSARAWRVAFSLDSKKGEATPRAVST